MDHAAISTSPEPVAVSDPDNRLRKKLLLVTPCIAPVPLAVSFVVKNFLGEFAPDEIVVAAERWPENPPDQHQTESGQTIEFVSQRWTWPKRGQRYFHWAKWFTLGKVQRRLADMVRRYDCGGILCIFPNEQLLYAAHKVALQTKVPFFPHFHNVYRENRRGWAKRIADYLQPRVFADSKIVFVMSSGMQRGWEKLYPRVKFVPLTHSNCDPVPDYTPAPAWPVDQIRMGFLGSINESNLEALGRIRELVRTTPELTLNIYSNAQPWFLEKVGLVGERVTACSPSDAELMGKLQTNDVLILPHGFEGGAGKIEYETIFPTRTIPYLLSLRPVLAHSPGFSFLNHWLRENDCAEIVDVKDVAALRDKLTWLRDHPQRRVELVQNALKAVRQFDTATVAKQFRQQVNPWLQSAH